MFSGMPGSLEAALVFALLIVPGYQIVRGYAVARGADAPPKDLYVLAQTIVASLVWLVLTWVAVEDLLRWISDDAVGEHTLAAYAIAPLVVGVPYAVGRGAGKLSAAVLRPQRPIGPRWFARLLQVLGLGGTRRGWDLAWARVAAADGTLVTLELDGGGSISGQFGRGSFVSLAPADPAVYLERAYELRDDGSAVTYAEGVYVDGARIVAVKVGRR
jgi:hypothetical protein